MLLLPFFLQLLAIQAAFPRFLNETAKYEFKEIKPVVTISVAQAQQDFEKAMLAS